LLLVTEDEGKKMLTKKGYVPSGSLSKPQKEKKSPFVFNKFRKSDASPKKRGANDTLPATVTAATFASRTSPYSSTVSKETSHAPITYRYEVLKKLVEALEERGNTV
jgi:hypothetical protein